MNQGQRKAIFLTNVPAPYRVEMLNLAQDMLANEGISLKVLFATGGNKRRAYWKDSLASARFSYRVLEESSLRLGDEYYLNPGFGLLRVLREERPDAIVSAGFSHRSLMAVLYTKRMKIPLIIYSGETLRTAGQRRLKWFRRKAQKFLLQNARCNIAYGTEAKHYLETLGAKDIFVAINSVNTQLLEDQPLAGNSSEGACPVRILAVSNLVPSKGLEYLLRAMRLLQAKATQPTSLTIVGGGPDEARLKQLVQELGLKNIEFLGALKPTALPLLYKESDLFVFPTLWDVFGLVLVEAAAAGLPLVASKYAGGTIDVVQEGVNGYITDPKNIEELADRLHKLCLDAPKRAAMGRESRRVIQESVNLRKCAHGFFEAVQCSLRL